MGTRGAFGVILFVLGMIPGGYLKPVGAEEIPLVRDSNTYLIPVRVNNSVTLNFTIDTGASNVVIPGDVVSTLMRTGTLTEREFIGRTVSVLADGSRIPSLQFVLREVQVGNQIIRNVVASVSTMKASPLLGQSFLSRLPSWSIDYRRHALVVNGNAGGPLLSPNGPPVATLPPAAVPAPPQVAPTTPAGTAMAQYVLGACRRDIAWFCSQVTPGDGRIKGCMKQHVHELSVPCKEALYQAWQSR
jgi:hypothetical protein